jgi:nicotinamidase-related amidase
MRAQRCRPASKIRQQYQRHSHPHRRKRSHVDAEQVVQPASRLIDTKRRTSLPVIVTCRDHCQGYVATKRLSKQNVIPDGHQATMQTDSKLEPGFSKPLR